MRTKFVIGLGLVAALAAGLALASPGNNGDMGIYLDESGNVVGTWQISCDGIFSYSGTRTSHQVTNGRLFCNLP